MDKAKKIFWNDSERRIRALWRLILQSAAWFALQLILGIAVGLIVFAAVLASGSDWPDVQTITDQLKHPVWMLVLKVGDFGIVILTVLLAGRFLDRRRFADFGFHFSARWWLDFAFGIFLGAFLMAAIFAVESAAGWLQVTAQFQVLVDGFNFPTAILICFVFFGLVGIAEELSSRGYQLKNLAEGFNLPSIGKRGAIAIATGVSSILFGFIHIANPNIDGMALVNLMAAGVFLALGYLLTGELAVSIGLHIAWNFFQGNVFGLPVSGIAPVGAQFLAIRQAGPDWITGGSFGPEGGLIGLGAMVFGSALIVLWARVTRGRVSLVYSLAESPSREIQARAGNDV